MADQLYNSNTVSPFPLYCVSLRGYVQHIQLKETKPEDLQSIPVKMLIEIYKEMSKYPHLMDLLYEHLSDLKTFEYLLNYSPARLELFRCFAAVVDLEKPLAQDLKRKYLEHFPVSCFPKAPKKLEKTKKINTEAIFKKSDIDCKWDIEESKCKIIKPSVSSLIYKVFYNNFLLQGLRKIFSKVRQISFWKKGANSKEEEDEPNEWEPINDSNGNDDKVSPEEKVEDNEEEEFVDLSLNFIQFGLCLGTFLCEAGWLFESIQILQTISCHLRLARRNKDKSFLLTHLDCLQRLLHAETLLCSFKTAWRTFDEIRDLLAQNPSNSLPKPLVAIIYTRLAEMHFCRSEFMESHRWASSAMNHLEKGTPETVVIDVIRQAAKCSIIKRDFKLGNDLCCQAIARAREFFGSDHPKLADAFADFAFFLLNIDNTSRSVQMFKEALELKKQVFGRRNILVAVAHMNLAYAFYVAQYRVGDFTSSEDHIEIAFDIMKDLVPRDHLILTSFKRVRALLYEENALDKLNLGLDASSLLAKAEELHTSALLQSLENFGEMNVQTAKHFGNLGRLYQSMHLFDKAEILITKAIRIKTDLLGPCDFEVALSLGHLASLYNYQMGKYKEAELLYLKSIDIGISLYGLSYSGLEYDYMGICHVYEKLQEYEKYLRFWSILEHWQAIHQQHLFSPKETYPIVLEVSNLDEVCREYFEPNYGNPTTLD